MTAIRLAIVLGAAIIALSAFEVRAGGIPETGPVVDGPVYTPPAPPPAFTPPPQLPASTVLLSPAVQIVPPVTPAEPAVEAHHAHCNDADPNASKICHANGDGTQTCVCPQD